jgi:hypothetical protein
MKIQTIDTQLWWIALPDEIRPSAGLDTAALFAALKDKFGFSRGPTPPAKAGVGGFEFGEGVFRRQGLPPIIIIKIEIFSDGISIAVPSNNEDAEFVFEEIENIFNAFGFRQPITAPLNYYLSLIVADFDVSLNDLFPVGLLETISKAIPIRANVEFQSVGFNADKSMIPSRIAAVNPTAFSIQRRIDVPYSMNRYFSQANATTMDHLSLLQEIENLAKKAK